jgi:tRNA pseudouridine38-40 synthase
MRRSFLALLHFDGTGFLGWQRQAAGRTVQAELETVLERLTGAPVKATAAGRTDAGVHALGLATSFLMPERWHAPEVRRALNALLPADVWVADVREMRAGFHARREAESRRYRYQIGCDAAAESPFRRRFEWPLGRPLDLPALARCAAVIAGEHDFRAFAAKGEPKPHYRCDVREARWEPRGDGTGLVLHIEADRFLHHMVRLLVGTMADVALGRRPADDMAELLTRRDNSATSPPAPPQGLYFVAARYPAACFAADAPAQAVA